MEERVMVKNSADAEQVEEAGRKLRFKSKTEAADLKAVMSTVQGRRVINRILAFCNVGKSMYRHDPHQMAYVTGAQDIGIMIQEELLNHCEAEHDLMVQEARKAVKNG